MVPVLLAFPVALLMYATIYLVILLENVLFIALRFAPATAPVDLLLAPHDVAWAAALAGVGITLPIVLGGYRSTFHDVVLANSAAEANRVMRQHKESVAGWYCFARLTFALPTAIFIANFMFLAELERVDLRGILITGAIDGLFVGLGLLISLAAWAVASARRTAMGRWQAARKATALPVLYTLILVAVAFTFQISSRGWRVGLLYSSALLLAYGLVLVAFFVIASVKSRKQDADPAATLRRRHYVRAGRTFHLDCLTCCIVLSHDLNKSGEPEEALRICRIARQRGFDHACIHAHQALAHNRLGMYEDALAAIRMARDAPDRCPSVDLDSEARHASAMLGTTHLDAARSRPA